MPILELISGKGKGLLLQQSDLVGLVTWGGLSEKKQMKVPRKHWGFRGGEEKMLYRKSIMSLLEV